MVVELVEPVTLGVGAAPLVSLPGALVLPGPAVLPVPGPPIEVEPAEGLPELVSVLAVPGEVEPVPMLPLVLELVPAVVDGGVVVLDELDDVVGVGDVASCFVQAPRDRAAATATAAAAIWVRDVFIRELLVGLGFA